MKFKKVYMKQTIPALILCFVFLSCPYALAEDGVHVLTPQKGARIDNKITDRAPSVPTRITDNYANLIQGEIDKKNTTEEKYGQPENKKIGTLLDNLPAEIKKSADSLRKEFKDNKLNIINQDVADIKYNKDGTINSLILDDGATISYSYERDRSGNLKACSMESGDVRIVFRSNESVNTGGIQKTPEAGEEYVVEIYLAGTGRNPPSPDNSGDRPPDPNKPLPNTKPGPDKPSPRSQPVWVFHGKADIDLEDIARKPVVFDFKSIGKAISQAAGLKDVAIREYQKSVSDYYQKVEKVLMEKKLLSGEPAEAPGRSGRREAVDRAIAGAYNASGQGRGTEELKELIAKERVLRNKMLIPAVAAYEARLKEAQAGIDLMIEKLIDSKLAVYMDVTKKKIDVVVKLPNKQKR